MDNQPDKNSLSIACCWWGAWPVGNESIGIDYVNKLYRATNEYLTIPHRFICFTEHLDADFDTGIEVLPIDLPSRKGETPKLMFYKPGNGLTGRVIGMDLDTVIIRNIDEFVREEEFIVRKAFGKRRRRMEIDGAIGGDMVSFDAGFGRGLWIAISQATQWFEQQTNGDERKAYNLLLDSDQITFWQDVLPERYLSKRPVLLSNPPDPLRNEVIGQEASVISFHGSPYLHELNHELVKEFWQEI